jgi:hypothetical protein
MSQALTLSDLEMFRRLLIPEAILERARVVRVDPKQAGAEFGIDLHGDSGGVAFPYFPAPNGTTLGRVTVRVRHDNPRNDENGKLRKYESPYGDNRHLYFAPCKPEWIKDPGTPLIFVEAEKSALAILAWSERHDRRLIPVGLGGCYNWRGRIGKTVTADGDRVDEKGPLSDLEIARDRKWYILYDSDVAKNDKVYAARENFVKALQDLHADVHVLNLPNASNKDGPDDFLATHDDSAFFTVFENVEHRTVAENWIDLFDTPEEIEDTPPLRFAVEGFLQCEAATLITGLSGDFKTWLALSLARSLLDESTKLWDTFAVRHKAARVIYLIPESARGPFHHRLKTLRLMPFVRNRTLLIRTLSKGPAPLLQDPKLLTAAQGSDVFLDTAVRFMQGDENSAGDNARGLATDVFALLGAGARTVIAITHSPKTFAKENFMELQNMVRGSGDIGAMFATAWGVRQLPDSIVNIQNIKPRDFDPCGPFQLAARPHITDQGGFLIHKAPGSCGLLADEMPDIMQNRNRKPSGASTDARESKAAKLALLRGFLKEQPNLTTKEIADLYSKSDIKIEQGTIRAYKSELSNSK